MTRSILIALVSGLLAAVSDAKPLNIVMIIADDLGIMDTSPYNPETFYDTPHLQALAASGTRFTNGYATFFAGKWHLGPEGSWPTDHGFDINMGGHSGGGPYGGKKYFSPYGNPNLPDGPDGEHLPDRLASETAKFIEANKDKPFLAYLSFYSVHTPLMGRP